MNKVLLTLIIVVSVFFVFQIISAMKNSDIETPKYEVVKTYKDFELRQYEAMLLATTNLGPSSYDQKSSEGFRTIASYIFGKNQTNEKIAMTAPVIYHADSASTLSFVVPQSNAKGIMPTPIDENISFVKQAPKLLAVLTFSGFVNDKKINQRFKELKKALQREGLEIKGNGNGYYFGYNPPWQLIGRKNEVAFELESVH
jgi:hypothetical protein